MWEEKSCSQVRQWQHWGSGCYQYQCQEGRLHMSVLNHTFTCFYPGQEIDVSLLHNNWLHTGSLVCPSCGEVCGEEFRGRGEKCRPGVLPPRTFYYPEHVLTCGGCRWGMPASRALVVAVALAVVGRL